MLFVLKDALSIGDEKLFKANRSVGNEVLHLKIAKLKTAYNSLIIGHKGLE